MSILSASMWASRPLFRHTGLKNKYEEPYILSSVDSLGFRRRLALNFSAFFSNKECQRLERKDRSKLWQEETTLYIRSWVCLSILAICVSDSEVNERRGVSWPWVKWVDSSSYSKKTTHSPFPSLRPLTHGCCTRRQCRVQEFVPNPIHPSTTTSFVQENPAITIWRISVHSCIRRNLKS